VKVIQKALLTLTAVTLLLLVAQLVAASPESATSLQRQSSLTSTETPATPAASKLDSFHGRLRIYIVEPTSRYRDFQNKNYQFGFLDFAVNQEISVDDGLVLTDTVIWNVGSIGAVSLVNIQAIAVVFGAEGHLAYSYPYDNTYPFTAYWAETAATSTPGVWGVDNATLPRTHTVFVEEGTATTCSNCPVTRAALDAIYTSGGYQFLYAAMVLSNSAASTHMFNDYNIGYTPSVYFDGGHGVYVGGSSNLANYTSRIDLAAARAVAPLKIAVKLEFISTTQLSVEYIIKTTNQAPDVPSTPTGPALLRTGKSTTFSASSLDHDADQLYYRWICDANDSSAWLGPYNSEETCSYSRSFTTIGKHDVAVLVKDHWDASATASTAFSVTVYRCGDADGNSNLSISDAVKLINYIFGGGTPPSPVIAGDADCNGAVSISDAVKLINHIFAGGSAPCSSCP
jgi:hypothetical protein